MSNPEDYLKLLDGFAGLAALVNGLILWPVVKSLKTEQSAIRKTLDNLLAKVLPKPSKKPARKRK